MTSRAVIRHKESELHRVVSVANGLWVAQTKVDPHLASDRYDPWQDMHAPCGQDRAVAIMYERKPVVKG